MSDTTAPLSSSSVAEFITNGAICPPLVGSPAAIASKMRRRFYHLGVERFEPPPRDADSLNDTETFCAYIPSGPPGCDANFELRRALQYHASGAPPPPPKYLQDVDRCKHFVHGRGGTDVAAHFVNRPSYQLSCGGPALSHYTPLLKQMLECNVRELDALRRAESPMNDNSMSSLRVRQLQSQSPAPVPVSALGSGASPSPSPSAAAAAAAVGSASYVSSYPYGCGDTEGGSIPPRRRVLSSLEVARRGSSLDATRSVRRRNELIHREVFLRKLTRMGHPNQITVFLPQ